MTTHNLERCRHGLHKLTCGYCSPRGAMAPVPIVRKVSAPPPSVKTQPELSGDLLTQYVPLARRRLIDLARERRTVYYGEIMKEFGGSGHIGKVLDEVNRQEHASGHPMLSALVIQKGTGRPSNGFWSLVAELHPNTGRPGFWEAECERIWAFDWR